MKKVDLRKPTRFVFFPCRKMYGKALVCARFRTSFHQKTGFTSLANSWSKMSPNAHFLYILQFLSRNVTFFALKHSSRSISAVRCENGPQRRLKTLYTYEGNEGVAKITKTRNYYYFAPEIEQN